MNLEITKELMNNKDEKYADFHSKLIPTISRDLILGVRIPILKDIAKNLAKNNSCKVFLRKKHTYYEEFMLHGLILGAYKFEDFSELMNEIEFFLPHIDNWAVCDYTVSSLKIIRNYYADFYKKCKIWLYSKNTYTIRFSIVILLNYYLDNEFNAEILTILKDIKTDEYYINMALSWFFSFALIKQYDKTINVFKEKKIINKWVHNKAIQKAIESYRISKERKEELRKLKLK